ncbi:MAG: PilZ domain-containing protein [Myxococcales bacterium]
MATYVPPRPPGRFLRYQFDSAAQLRRHCRLVDGRVLLFFPEPRPSLGERARVLIELCVANSDQQVALPAMVHSRAWDAPPGIWLELRALSVVAGLQSAIIAPRRKQRRLALDQLAWVDHGDGPVLACPVLDISEGGARLWGVPGGAPRTGERIRIRLPHAQTLVGRIAWARGREVGLEYVAESLNPAADLYARVESLWNAARVACHNPSCGCAAGAETLDPPHPLRQRREGGVR